MFWLGPGTGLPLMYKLEALLVVIFGFTAVKVLLDIQLAAQSGLVTLVAEALSVKVIPFMFKIAPEELLTALA